MVFCTDDYLILIIFYDNKVKYDITKYGVHNDCIDSAVWYDNDRDATYMEMLYEDGRINTLNSYAERCYNMHV